MTKKLEKEYGFFPINKGEIIMNLGAHIGGATLFFSMLVGDEGLVIAVEPVVENYRVLMNVIIENKLTNVIPLLIAVGKNTSRGIIYFSTGTGGHSLVFKYDKKRIVPIISWDDLVTTLNLKHIDLAKVDIEGSEIGFLEGMNKVLPNRIIMEDHSWLGSDKEQLMKLIEYRNYKVVRTKEHLLYLQRK